MEVKNLSNLYGKSYSEFKFTYEESISKLSDIEHKYSGR